MNEMNKDDQLLAEVRKISAYAEMQKKVTKWSLIIVSILVPIIIVVGFVTDRAFKKKIETITTTAIEPKDWYDVDRLTRRGDITQAIHVAEAMIQKMPRYTSGHEKLGPLYLIDGDIPKSLKHFKEAFRLFPSEQNRKNLEAVMK